MRECFEVMQCFEEIQILLGEFYCLMNFQNDENL